MPKGVGRRLPPQHIHLTLAFLGSISEQQEQCVCRTAEGVHGQGFTLRLDSTGHFPRPQVVWVGVSQLPLALQALQTQLVSELTRLCGYQPEARAFMPHLTLWRKVRRVELPETIPPITWPVSRFVLARSRTLPTGAEYSIVQEWPLAAAQE